MRLPHISQVDLAAGWERPPLRNTSGSGRSTLLTDWSGRGCPAPNRTGLAGGAPSIAPESAAGWRANDGSYWWRQHQVAPRRANVRGRGPQEIRPPMSSKQPIRVRVRPGIWKRTNLDGSTVYEITYRDSDGRQRRQVAGQRLKDA